MTKNPTPMQDAATEYGRPITGWRLRLYTIVFEANMRAGRAFDLTLIACILASVAVVVLDSMSAVHDQHAALLGALEWTFTLLFTAEYLARLLCVRHPGRYARSVFGIIDPLAVLPAYLAVLVPGLHADRCARLAASAAVSHLQAGCLRGRVRRTRPSAGCVTTTMTTVGFGDITPKTDLGRLLASAMMLLGWGTLAVPTGIVSAEFTAKRFGHAPTTRTCHDCLSEGHSPDAAFCRDCGAPLPAWQSNANSAG